MARRTASADQMPLFGDVIAPPTTPALDPAGREGAAGLRLPAPAAPPADGRSDTAPPAAPPSVSAGDVGIPPREGDETFHAWTYSGLTMTPAERLRDVRRRFLAIYGEPPVLIAVRAGEADAYAGLDALVEARTHVPADMLWLLVPPGARDRRHDTDEAGGAEGRRPN